MHSEGMAGSRNTTVISYRRCARCDRVGDVIVLPRRSARSVSTLASWCSAASSRGKQARILARRALDGNECTGRLTSFFAATCSWRRWQRPSPKFLSVPLWVQVHGIEAWHELSVLHRRSVETATLITSVSRYTRRRLLAVGRNRSSSSEGPSKHRGSTIPAGTKAQLPTRASCCGRKEGADDGVPPGQLGAIQGP